MLKVSDGDWKKLIKIRCVSGQGTSGEALNQVITGRTSGGLFDGTSTFQQGVNSISEFEVENVKGTFQNRGLLMLFQMKKMLRFHLLSRQLLQMQLLKMVLHSQSEAL